VATPRGLVSCELQAVTIFSILVDKPSSATWMNRRGGRGSAQLKAKRQTRALRNSHVTGFRGPCGAYGCSGLHHRPHDPLEIPPARSERAVPYGQHISRLLPRDNGLQQRGLSRHDSHSLRNELLRLRVLGVFPFLCRVGGAKPQRHAIIHGAFDSLPCEKGAPEV
jgi:hypothetical protein